MSGADYSVVAVYFIAIAIIGVWASRQREDTSDDYFLGGRGMGWPAIGASLFASNISAEHFIGLAGTGAESGLAVGQFEWLACLILLLLGWLFVPHYLRTRVYTMPEFLSRRFGPGCQTYLSAVSLVAYVFTKVSVAVYAGALVLQTVLGWNIWVGAIVLVAATGVYTVFGGLRAVVYTDFAQCAVLLGGAALLTWLALSKVGGFGAIRAGVPPEFLSVWRPASDAGLPWTGIVFGAPILGIWYWCTDQMIVQRTLAARDLPAARKATLLAGYLKVAPVFILVLPGIAGRLLLPGRAPNQIYAEMVTTLLPSGLRGLVIAGLLAALMSSLSSVFNSASTLAVMDFYRRLRPEASEKRLVRAGQLATVALVVVGLLWLPFINVISDQLFVYLQSVQAYISPPIAAVFLFGLLDKRVNNSAALLTLWSGLAGGALRFVAEIGVKRRFITTPWLVRFATINFLHFAALSFAASAAVLVIVSRFGAPPHPEQIALLQPAGDAPRTPAQRSNVVLSLALVVALGALWIVFSPLVLAKPR
ncbi:MAG: sodium:solute symporter [Myxococcales bacterium]|nr:sodium:solute symporter [Myxococcales bacterium]